MDAEGYLPIQLIASFHRVQSMTRDLKVILTAIQSSEQMELKESNSNHFVRPIVTPTKWPIVDSHSKQILHFHPTTTQQPEEELDNEEDTTIHYNITMLNPNVPEFIPNNKHNETNVSSSAQ